LEAKWVQKQIRNDESVREWRFWWSEHEFVNKFLNLFKFFFF